MSARTLPIFPLRIVLFPGTPQLLHIFEPRYRQLLADCQEDDHGFGISLVKHPAGIDPAPAPGDVGCEAHIQEVWPQPDGRSNILVVGERRYVLERYVETDRLYRVATVRPFEDEVTLGVDPPGEMADVVGEHFRRFTAALNVLTDTPNLPIELPDDPTALSFHIAAALDIDVSLKQSLLELRSTPARLQLLREQLASLNAEAGKRVRVHRRSKRNGRGNASSLSLEGR